MREVSGNVPPGDAEHIDVVETGATQPVITDVDVVLYDTFGQTHGTGIDLEDFVRDSGAKVVIYSDGPTGWKSYKAAVLAASGNAFVARSRGTARGGCAGRG